MFDPTAQHPTWNLPLGYKDREFGAEKVPSDLPGRPRHVCSSWTATEISRIPPTAGAPVCSADSFSGTAISVFDTASRAVDVREQEGGSSGLPLLR
jgi:hypothetical protein